MSDTPLPYAEEIREARRLSQEAQDAALDLHKLGSAIQSAAILRTTARMQGPDFVGPLPGTEALEDVLSRWEALSTIADHGPEEDAPYVDQLHARLAQLKSAEQLLTPIAGEASVRSNTLARLQHQQQQALADPEWADIIDELGELGMARDTAARELAPLNQRLAMLDPAMNLLRTYLSAIKGELQRAKTLEDVDASQAYRTARLAANLVEALGALLDHVRLEIPLPAAPELGDSPDVSKKRWYWKEVVRVSTELTELLKVLKIEGGALRTETNNLNAEYEKLTTLLMERMG